MDQKELALKQHYDWKGKIEVISRTPIKTNTPKIKNEMVDIISIYKYPFLMKFLIATFYCSNENKKIKLLQNYCCGYPVYIPLLYEL